MSGPGGWGEPRLGALRTVAALGLLAMLGWLIVAEQGPKDTAVIGTILGGLLVVLGYEVGRRHGNGGGSGD